MKKNDQDESLFNTGITPDKILMKGQTLETSPLLESFRTDRPQAVKRLQPEKATTNTSSNIRSKKRQSMLGKATGQVGQSMSDLLGKTLSTTGAGVNFATTAVGRLLGSSFDIATLNLGQGMQAVCS